MKIYWSMNSVPELDGLERKEKAKRYREMFKYGRKQLGIMPFVYMVIVGLVVGVLTVLLDFGAIARGALIGGAIGAVSIFVLQSPAIEHGRAWYREQYGPTGSGGSADG